MLEITDKISSYMKKHNLINLLKVCIILITLFLIVRLATQNTVKSVENFITNTEKFGNEIGYIKSSNSNNSEYTFKLDEQVQLDTILFSSTTTVPTFQYIDGNNNTRIFNLGNGINLTDIDNNKIITDTIIISNPVMFIINKIEFYGTKVGMINRDGFNNFPSQTSMVQFSKQGTSNNTFTYNGDILLNAITFQIASNTPPAGVQSVKYNIYYYNNIYPGTKFTISNSFKIRVDGESSYNKGTTTTAYLYKPIIANKIIIDLEPVVDFNISISSPISVNGKPASSEEKNLFKINNQSVIDSSKDSSDATNLCPTMDEIMDKQTKAQQICDNIEYQDKIKSEKIRLEKNRQYLLKLKAQEEQIDELNGLIGGLQDRRTSRDTNNDMLRVARFQKQKEEASVVRDLANLRKESQDQNKLFFNVNVNAK